MPAYGCSLAIVNVLLGEAWMVGADRLCASSPARLEFVGNDVSCMHIWSSRLLEKNLILAYFMGIFEPPWRFVLRCKGCGLLEVLGVFDLVELHVSESGRCIVAEETHLLYLAFSSN